MRQNANDHATVENTPRADHTIKAYGYLGCQTRVCANARACAHVALGANQSALLDDRAGLDHSQRANAHVRTDHRSGIHDGRRMNASDWTGTHAA